MHTADVITDRKNMTGETFRAHCSDYLSAVVGMVEWKGKETQMKISKIATPSDEAFCLVTLENNCDRWTAIARKEPRFEVASEQSDDLTPKKKEELWPSPKCTKQKSANGKKHEGWSKEGAESHNQHHHSISKLQGESVDDRVQTGAEQKHVEEKEKIEAWHMDEKKKGGQHKKKRKAQVFEPPELAGEDEENIKF